jgi:hypothetical protein
MLAVMVVLAVAGLVAAGLLAAGEAEQAGLAAMHDRSQQRANAWSGAQAVAALLAQQRGAVLDGEDPELPDEVLLWEGDGYEAVARLLPVGPGGERLVAEMGKLPLATATAERLAQTSIVDPAAAAAAIARRDGSDAIEGLVAPDAGLPVELVLGPVAMTIADGVRQAKDDAGGGRSVGGSSAARAVRAAGGAGGGGGGLDAAFGAQRPLALADAVTPFGAQRALGNAGGSAAPRVPLAEWSDAAIQAIDAAGGAGAGGRVRDALGGKPPADDGDLVRAMAKAQLPPAAWGAVLDAVIAAKEPIEHGRIDLLHAPEAVLRTLPGIDDALAARLAQERRGLDLAMRARVSWPVEKGVLDAERFAAVAPYVCVRSWLWRARVATGTIDRARNDGALHGVQVTDVVVDLAEDPPRFAALRDCTMLPIAGALAAEAMAREDQARLDGGDDRGGDGEGTGGAAWDDAGEGGGSMAAAPKAVRAPEPARAPAVAAGGGAGGGGGADGAEGGTIHRDESVDRTSRGAASGARDRTAWTRGTWKDADAVQRATEAAQAREWKTLADREKERRDARNAEQAAADAKARADAAGREWKTLGEREKDRADAKRREWKSLAERERERSAAKQDEWKSLGSREADRREARQQAERDRRANTWESGGWPQLPPITGPDAPAPDPRQGNPDASDGADPGRDPAAAPPADAPAGGLSGRWRRNGG